MAEQSPAPFIIGETYLRRSLHQAYGGQWQSGISTPSSGPYIFLFTGDSGKQYGYHDGFQADQDIFWYTGEGQKGDMQMKGGNLAILNHVRNGRELHLFESIGNATVRYLGQAECVGHHTQISLDLDKRPREAIVFHLVMAPDSRGKPFERETSERDPELKRLLRKSLAELRELAFQTSGQQVPRRESTRTEYRRSVRVKAYVLRRADGTCEGCGQPAPFTRANGEPYLEPHHLRRLADEGPDEPQWVAALCPNCHRRVHHGGDATAYNAQVRQKIAKLEGG